MRPALAAASLASARDDPVGVCDVVKVGTGPEAVGIPRNRRLTDAPLVVTCETISDETSFAALAAPWDGLVRAMPRPSPFMLHGWLLEWWRHFGHGSELAVHIARREGQLVGALPLFVRSRWGVRVASFLGDGESALGDLLLAEGMPASVSHRLIELVAASRIDAVDVFGLPRESRLAATIGPSRIQVIERVEAPVIDLGRDWETFYEAKLSSSRRREIRRRSRNLASEGVLTVTLARSPLQVFECPQRVGFVVCTDVGFDEIGLPLDHAGLA